MRSPTQKLANHIRRGNMKRLLRGGIKYVGSHAMAGLFGVRPYKVVVANGVAVRDVYLLEAVDVKPEREQELIDGIHAAVEPGDRVVLIGGHTGCSTVHAARCVGEEGRVTVFEAADHVLPYLRETVEMNNVADRVDVVHGLVAEDRGVYGDTSADVIRPEELQSCDVLVMDCEGAELPILESMEIRPRALVVETHRQFNAPVETVGDVLVEDLDYVVTDVVEVERSDGNVHVIVAERGVV